MTSWSLSCESSAGTASLFGALQRSTIQLVNEYPGNYNYLLTNGGILFAFTNHRQLMLLKGSSNLGTRNVAHYAGARSKRG